MKRVKSQSFDRLRIDPERSRMGQKLVSSKARYERSKSRAEERKVKSSRSDSLLTRGVVEVINRGNLINRLKRGDRLRIKLGIDPNEPNLHLGHAVPLRKLREFQKVGHQAVIVIGDWTAQIGDPTGKDKTRTSLTHQVVQKNAKQCLKQILNILDPDSTEVHFQSEWYGKFRLSEVFELASRVSVHQLLGHETFQNRVKKHLPLALHEFMYPIIQGYDSVALNANVELGAVEQKFNLLMGRHIQKVFNQPEQDVIMMPYLTGTDGKEKMSKSLGNTINLTDPPEEVYGKVMSIPDHLIVEYFTLGTDLTDKGLAVVKQEVKDNPRMAKAHLAFLITEMLYDELAAESAQAMFEEVHMRRQAPKSMPVFTIHKTKLTLLELLRVTRLALSNSAARRLVEQGGVKINGQARNRWVEDITIGDGLIIQVGKRNFAKVIGQKP